MTTAPDFDAEGAPEPRPSMLPFNPADLTALRVSPAQFARMCGVSRTAVSQWVKDGKVTLGPDGRLDPAKAAREVIARTDPARLRARVFRDAVTTREALLARIRELEEQLAALHVEHDAIVSAARNQFADQQAECLAVLEDEIDACFDRLIAARAAGVLPDRLDELVAHVFYPDTCAPAEAVAAEADTATDAGEAASTHEEPDDDSTSQPAPL